MTQVKICGIKRPEHGLAALDAGADLLGFIFYPPSHRYVPPRQAREVISHCREWHLLGWRAVGVFVDETVENVNLFVQACGLDLVQLAGSEDPDFCSRIAVPVIKVVRVDDRGQPEAPTDPAYWNADRVLLDTSRPGHYGGTGESYDWAAVRPFAGQALLAGGLTPANVSTALLAAQPWGLDVSSGVERDREKDPDLIRAFLHEVRHHDRAPG